MSSPFFENIISGIQVVYTRTFQWTLSEFSLISDFLTEILKANKNYWKRSLILQYSFAQKTSLILRISFHLTLKTIYSRNTTKTLSVFTNIPENIFRFSVWNNICTAPFLDAQEPHSWKASRCTGLAKCFKIFHFNWKFWKSNYFSAFQYFYL